MSQRWNYAAQGLLSGLSSAVDTMFKVEIEKDRENRLQAIADKNYKRDRADQLADIESQRGFQKGLLEEERGFQRERDLAKFGQQVTLSELNVKQQKDLLAEAAKYPSSALGKLLQDRDNATDQDNIDALTRQIGMSQLITSTDSFGAITFASPTFGPNNEITELTELGTFGGLGGGGLRDSTAPGSSTEENTPPQPPISSLDAPTIERSISQLEQALETGELRGLTKPQIERKLIELRQALNKLNSQAANPAFGALNDGFAGLMKP